MSSETFRARIKSHEHDVSALSVITVTATEMLTAVYPDGLHEPDARFRPFKEGGAFKYFFPKDVTWSNRNIDNTYFTILKEDDVIVGMAMLEEDPNDPTTLWGSFLSVDMAYQGRGFSKIIMSEAAVFATNRGYGKLQLSRYSPDGELMLKPKIAEYAAQLAFELIEG